MSEAEVRLLKLTLTIAQQVVEDAHKLADVMSVANTRYHLLYSDLALLMRLLDADLSNVPEDIEIDELRARLNGALVGWKVQDDKKNPAS